MITLLFRALVGEEKNKKKAKNVDIQPN